jgi:Rho-binding antiterminator
MANHDYQPISCDFHDLLEVHATKRRPTHIQFRDADGQLQTRDAVITDVYAKDGADYLTLNTGEILRLDQLIEVDQAKLADYRD